MENSTKTPSKYKDALLSLIQGPDGAIWSRKRVTGWTTDSDNVCLWDGIKCSGDEIHEINLENTRLVATIPTDLGKITSIKYLYLGSNKLFGEIPKKVASLPNLVHLDLSMNLLRGSVPIFTSPMLETINLSHNHFSGKLPSDIGVKMSGAQNLVSLSLKYNSITGSIPQSIGNLPPSLLELDLSDNMIAGTMPDSIGNLVLLEGLFLSNNRLTGRIPNSITRSHLALSQVFLQGNKLTGSLPVALADLPRLTNLFVDDNKLTGSIPNELCDMNLNGIFFQDSLNETAGRYDCSEDLGCIRDGCNSIACPAGYRSTSTGKDGVFPCKKCDDALLNPYIGASFCFLMNQNEILTELYYETNGTNWVGDYGMWTTLIPVCQWKGIACNSLGSVESIVLPGSNLTGPIPPNLGFLRHLEVLDFSNNHLTGEIPSELQYAPLEVLDLSDNELVGFVPQSLCGKAGVNGNGLDGVFSCQKIACPVGTYSPSGRGGGADGECISCAKQTDQYLARTVCGGVVATSPTTMDAGAIAGVIIVSMLINSLLCFGLYAFRRSRRMMTIDHNEDYKERERDEFVDPEDEVPTSYISSRRRNADSSEDQEADFPLSVQLKARDAWNRGKESTKEVWLDVPKIN